MTEIEQEIMDCFKKGTTKKERAMAISIKFMDREYLEWSFRRDLIFMEEKGLINLDIVDGALIIDYEPNTATTSGRLARSLIKIKK